MSSARWIGTLAMLAGFLVACSRQPAFRGTTLDPPRETQDFTLRDQFGAPVRLSDFRGRSVGLTFLYTFCPDVCPLVTANLHRPDVGGGRSANVWGRWFTLVSLLVAGAGLSTAWAHGGALVVARARAGPYVVSVWALPNPPRVGRWHVTVAVMRPEDGAPVLDARAHATAKFTGREGMPISAGATVGGGGNPLFQDMNLELSREGRWRITVLADGPAGRGSVAFDVQVAAPSVPTWLLLGFALGGAALVSLAWQGLRAWNAKDRGARLRAANQNGIDSWRESR